MYAVYKRPNSYLETNIDWKWGDGNGIPCRWKSKENWSSWSLSDKIEFKIKIVTKDKEHDLMIKGSVLGEYITVINIHHPT